MMKRVEGRRPAARWNRYDAVRRIVEERDLVERRVVRRGTWPVSIGRLLLLLLVKMRVMPVSVLLVIASVTVGVLARVPAMLLGAVPVLLPVMPVGVMFVITSVAVGVLARMPVMLVSVVLMLLPLEGLLSEWCLCRGASSSSGSRTILAVKAPAAEVAGGMVGDWIAGQAVRA